MKPIVQAFRRYVHVDEAWQMRAQLDLYEQVRFSNRHFRVLSMQRIPLSLSSCCARAVDPNQLGSVLLSCAEDYEVGDVTRPSLPSA